MDNWTCILTVLVVTTTSTTTAVKIQNTHDVAPQKKGTLASSVSGWDILSSSVDGDPATCAKTTRELKPWWALDLGADNTYTIVGLRINTGDNVLEHIEIWVGPNPGTSSGNAYCNRHLASNWERSEINVACVTPVNGRYVTITVLEHAYLGLCEVNIYECVEGYFGEDCSQECHCSGGAAACPRLTGQCDCAAGWTGATCQTSCEAGKFGENCLGSCHCKDGKTCNGTTGECPTQDCVDNWVGQTCQTEIPDMTDQLYRPIAVEKTSRTITLEWRGWEKFVDVESMLVYWIEYKPHRVHKPGMTTFEPNWMRRRVHVSASGDQYQRALVADLTTNTNYLFRVVPYIQTPGEAPIQGQPTPDGGPYKTRCTDPDPPMIRHIEPIVDDTTDPPKVLFNVKWQAPSRHFVHCDNIKHFKISYQAETGTWKSLLASNRMQSKNITNVHFNVRYNIKVTAVNNEDFMSESPVEVGLVVPEIVDTVDLLEERTINWGMMLGVAAACTVVLVCLLAISIYCLRKSQPPTREKYGTLQGGHDTAAYEVPMPAFAAPRPSRFQERDIVEPYMMKVFTDVEDEYDDVVIPEEGHDDPTRRVVNGAEDEQENQYNYIEDIDPKVNTLMSAHLECNVEDEYDDVVIPEEGHDDPTRRVVDDTLGATDDSHVYQKLQSYDKDVPNMAAWLRENKVSAATCLKLQEEMVRDLQELAMVKERAVEGMNLPVGEQVRLLAAIQKLQNMKLQGE